MFKRIFSDKMDIINRKDMPSQQRNGNCKKELSGNSRTEKHNI